MEEGWEVEGARERETEIEWDLKKKNTKVEKKKGGWGEWITFRRATPLRGVIGGRGITGRRWKRWALQTGRAEVSKSTLSLILTRLSDPVLFLRIEAEETRAKDRELLLFFSSTRGTMQGSESRSLKPRERDNKEKPGALRRSKSNKSIAGFDCLEEIPECFVWTKLLILLWDSMFKTRK